MKLVKSSTNSTRWSSYRKARKNKLVWFWCENRRIDQWDRIEKPEMDLYICDQLTITVLRQLKGVKDIHILPQSKNENKNLA